MYSSQVQGRDDSVVGLARQRRAAARAARRARPRAARDPAPPAGARPAVQRASGNTRTCMQPLPWPSRAAGAPAATCAHTCTRLQQAAPRARRVILMPKRKWSSALPANSAACSAGLPAGAPRRRAAPPPAPPSSWLPGPNSSARRPAPWMLSARVSACANAARRAAAASARLRSGVSSSTCASPKCAAASPAAPPRAAAAPAHVRARPRSRPSPTPGPGRRGGRLRHLREMARMSESAEALCTWGLRSGP